MLPYGGVAEKLKEELVAVVAGCGSGSGHGWGSGGCSSSGGGTAVVAAVSPYFRYHRLRILEAPERYKDPEHRTHDKASHVKRHCI